MQTVRSGVFLHEIMTKKHPKVTELAKSRQDQWFLICHGTHVYITSQASASRNQWKIIRVLHRVKIILQRHGFANLADRKAHRFQPHCSQAYQEPRFSILLIGASLGSALRAATNKFVSTLGSRCD